MIVEDDHNFAKILLDLARDKGFKGVVARSGEEALVLAKRYRPDAITLDLQLPGMHGLALLDRLKHDANTRHIPVHIVSIVDDLPRGKKMGAVSQIKKPVTEAGLRDSLSNMQEFIDRPVKNLLVVEDNEAQRLGIEELVGGADVKVTSVGSGQEALDLLKKDGFDCVVVDLGLPDMGGFELIKTIRHELKLSDLPIIVYTGKDLSPAEAKELSKIAESVIVKDLESVDRLLDETALFLHRVESNLPEEKRQMIQKRNASDSVLAGKKILVVDDDIRNIFALTSFLERHKMQVVYAEGGEEALNMLQQNPDIDVVLMDVMMPGMDGYEATKLIRKNPKYKSLPIIAVTAKAMKGDREKCIQAGSSDYITKPVDVEQLLSLLRVWLFK
jgi:CheY-like chemotaxis protein